MSTTQRTVDFNKVQWADYFWINGKGDQRRKMPEGHTVNGDDIVADAIAWPMRLAFPHETMLQRARRLEILDVWRPVCRLNISANRTLTYVGIKATAIWKAYNKHIYYGKR